MRPIREMASSAGISTRCVAADRCFVFTTCPHTICGPISQRDLRAWCHRQEFPPDVWLRTVAPCPPLPARTPFCGPRFPAALPECIACCKVLPPAVPPVASISAALELAVLALALACEREQHFLYFFDDPHAHGSFGFWAFAADVAIGKRSSGFSKFVTAVCNPTLPSHHQYHYMYH